MRFRRTISLAFVASVLPACGQDERIVIGGPIGGSEPSATVFDEQPMIADIELELVRRASVRVEVAEDPGARSETVLDVPAGPLTLRVRGLPPDSDVTAEVVLEASDGKSERLPLSFRTPAALPGFVPSFEVTGTGAPGFRLFDQTETPDIVEAGIFAVDAQGKTRFYLPSLGGDADADVHLRPPAGVKLEDDGTLTYLQNGRLVRVDELGTVLLDVAAEDVGVDGFHHDVIRMPNGNLLAMGHEFGQFPDPLSGQLVPVAGDSIVELTPDGEKVWEWSSFDHLDPQRVPGPDYYIAFVTNPDGVPAHDWTHGNGIVYSEADDSILMSLRHQEWIVKIDHGTGSVVWVLGNGGDFTLESGTWFFHQHSPEWQPDGSLLLYDNGAGNPDLPDAEERSRPVRYVLDEKSMTATQAWDETNETYMSLIAGDADRLENGNVLVLDSALPNEPGQPFSLNIHSRLREVDPATNTWVWTLTTAPNRFVYRATAIDRLPGEARE